FDLDLRVTPGQIERAITQQQMLEGFLSRQRRELFQKRKVVDPRVAHAQRSFASRTFQLWIFSRPMNCAGARAGKMSSPLRGQPTANWQPIETHIEIDALIFANSHSSRAVNAFVA